MSSPFLARLLCTTLSAGLLCATGCGGGDTENYVERNADGGVDDDDRRGGKGHEGDHRGDGGQADDDCGRAHGDGGRSDDDGERGQGKGVSHVSGPRADGGPRK